MAEPVNYEIDENIAVIALNSPPVNGLSLQLRTAIWDAYQSATQDNRVAAIVISSTGKNFCGGADIGEFGSAKVMANPNNPELFLAIENSTKPVVAAINGVALGGGCELVLACDYRIALAGAQLGLPEVTLGLLPGAGGTQRLARLAGPQVALRMVMSGKAISAEDALQLGIVDRLHKNQNDFLEAAVGYARELVGDHAPLRNCAEIEIDVAELPGNFFDDFRQSIARRTRGFYAQERCVQAIEAACELPFAEGLEKEQELFQECMDTPQARAQQHLFFAERAAARIPGVDSKTEPRKIRKVAIIGAGTMGGGIAMNFINAGLETIIVDLSAEALQRGISAIENNYEISRKKGRLTQERVEQAMALLSTTTEYADIADVDLVIEAVFEKMEIKKKVFQILDRICKPGAILATNTSTLDVNEIANITRRPADVIGLHFFSPANVMRLLEIVRGAKTAGDVLLTAIGTAQKIGKVPVVAGVCWGFIGNRMLEPYGREVCRLILEGATPAQIDSVLSDFGLAMGFPSMIDLAGIDVSYLVRQGNREAFYFRDPNYAAIMDKLYELGRYGQKVGRGFYIYEGRDKHEDPEVIQLAAELADKAGIKQRKISDREILERTLYMLINEGAAILDEGVAYRSGDIDVVYCNGYGFPIHKGGPMQYADEIGLDRVLTVINHYRRNLGDYGEEWFKPAPLLEKLVSEGRRFKDYVKG